MKQDNAREIFPVVDPEGNIVGKATRGECHGGSMLLHPVVHLHIFDRQGRLYLQKRPQWKDIQPGRWDTAVGGHIDFGETVDQALRREAREEVGLEEFTPEFLKSYVFQSERERELVNSFRTTISTQLTPSDELETGRWWTTDEITANLDNDTFTPNFAREYRSLFMTDAHS